MHKRVVCGGGGVGGWVGCRPGGPSKSRGNSPSGHHGKQVIEECSGEAQTTPSKPKAGAAPQRCRRG